LEELGKGGKMEKWKDGIGERSNVSRVALKVRNIIARGNAPSRRNVRFWRCSFVVTMEEYLNMHRNYDGSIKL